MSGFRELVTGADGCSAGDGAGPSNAAASLADALLGRRAKQQAQLQEVKAAGCELLQATCARHHCACWLHQWGPAWLCHGNAHLTFPSFG